MNTKLALENLIINCQSDQERYFQEVYHLLIDQVFSYLRSRSKNNDDATDLTQEVFIDLYQALPTFNYRSEAEFYGFLYLICKRKLAKYYKRQPEEEMPGDDFFENIPDRSESQNINIDIDTALSKLNSETREILILHHWQRHTFKEIAALLNITEATARVRHHRALSTLSTLLTKT
jgi:RNA polymerase sigma-70 factor, ECF subfamily